MEKFSWLYNKKYFFYILLGLLVFIPLYPKFPLIGVSQTFVSIRLEDLFIAIIALVWYIGNFGRIRYLLSQTIIQVILLFWFVGALSVFSGIFVTHSVTPSLGLFHWLRRVEYMLLFIIAATSIRNLEDVKLTVKVILITAFIIILYGFGQILLHFPVISTTNSEFSKGIVLYLTQGARVNSTFAGHYDLAMYLSMVLMIVAGFFFYYKGIKNKIQIFIVGVLGFILLGLTAARVSFVAAIVGLALTFWLGKKRLLVVGLIVVSFALVFAIPELRHRLVATVTVNLLGGGGPKYSPPPGKVTIFTPVNDIPEASRAQILAQVKKDATDPAKRNTTVSADAVAGEPINTTELGVFRSYGIRLNVEWPRAMSAFYKNPMIGTGYSSITLATDNDFLRSLGETGILGTITLGMVFFMLFRKMIRYLKHKDGFELYFVISMFCSTIVLLITALFIDVFEASKVAEIYWLLMGINWAVLTNFNLNREHSS